MVMFCRARLHQDDAAVERGLSALEYGQLLKPDVRAMTSLPLAAVDLLRVIEPERVASMEAVKGRFLGRTDAAREHLERSSRAVETGADVQQPEVLDATFRTDTTAALDAAAGELEGLAAAGGEQFTDAFAVVRALFHTAWPHALLDALPRAAVEPAAPVRPGVTAS